MMTWLANRKVAAQVLKAKQHRRYPGSNRPSSTDRKMIFLGIAVAAGIWEIEFSTALRKLAQNKIGIENLIQDVHRFDCLEKDMARDAVVFAESIDSYFLRLPNGEWHKLRNLPCEIPKDFHGGFIVYGYDSNGKEIAAFSRTLPRELADTLTEPKTGVRASQEKIPGSSPNRKEKKAIR